MISDRMASIGTLAAGVAHEIKSSGRGHGQPSIPPWQGSLNGRRDWVVIWSSARGAGRAD